MYLGRLTFYVMINNSKYATATVEDRIQRLTAAGLA